MKTSHPSPRRPNPFLPLLLLVPALVSCQPAPAAPTSTPVIQTVEVTREVTRIVEVPVTVTPTQTPEFTYTPSITPTFTRTPGWPVVTILVHAACNYGPGGAYLWNYGLNATTWMEVIGRNTDGTWLFVEGVHGWNPCWVKAELVRFNDGGDVSNYNIPITEVTLPYSRLYKPPQAISTTRIGDTVRIFWQPVWMTEDDYRGYLIEAWVCQEDGEMGLQQVFRPIKVVGSYADNSSMRVLDIEDKPGCLVPSSARIYTAEKHGYTGFMMIPWPAAEPAATSTP